MPNPLRIPFTASLPNGPASKVAGGIPESGPVMEGDGSAAGAAGAGAAAGAAEGAAAWSAGLAWSGAGAAGGFCARQTAANPMHRAITARLFPRIPVPLLCRLLTENVCAHGIVPASTPRPSVVIGRTFFIDWCVAFCPHQRRSESRGRDLPVSVTSALSLAVTGTKRQRNRIFVTDKNPLSKGIL